MVQESPLLIQPRIDSTPVAGCIVARIDYIYATRFRVASLWGHRSPRVPHPGLPAVNSILPVPGKILKLVTLSGSSPGACETFVLFWAIAGITRSCR